MKQEELIELIYGSLPYSFQIEKLDISEPGAVRFTWRSSRYRVSTSLLCETVDESLLVGSDSAILMQAILGKSHFEKGKKAA